MQKWEREVGKNPSEKTALTALERIFGVRTPAKVIAFDPSRGFSLDRLPDASELAHPYSSIFGGKREIGKEYPDVEDFGEKTDSFHMHFVREHEAEYMADFLFKPSLSPEQIIQRQDILRRLVESKDLDELVKLKNKSYRILEGISHFGVEAGNESNHETFVGLYHAGEKVQRIYEDEFGSDVKRVEDLFPYVFECVDEVEDGLTGLKELWEALNSQDEQIRHAFTEVLDSITDIRSRLAPYVPFDKNKDVKVTHRKEDPEEDREDRLWHEEWKADALRGLEEKEIAPRLYKIGTIIEFAKKIRDDGWAQVTFDPTKPFGYKGGWNLERRKDKQVQNDSPEESPVVVLSGANTSGKSYMMRSDFLMRICAQSLGFAPAEEANFPVHDSFVYLDRASTDPGNDLSAFMREVKNWEMALSNTGPNSRWYVDEGYSTTSPKDQAALLLATAKYITSGKGSIVLATHNDNVIDRAIKDNNSGIYHLKTEVGENGELIRYFELKPGPMESLSIAVAKARKFPSKVLDWAIGYFKHEIKKPEVSKSSNFPKIESFSETEREKDKLLQKSLDHIFPNKPSNPILSLFSLDDDFKGWLLGNLVRGKDFFTKSVECADPHEFGEIMDYLTQMIMWNKRADSKDLLERQKMFRELSQGDIAKRLQSGLEKIGFLEEELSLVARHAAEVNKGLNIFHRDGPSLGDRRIEFDSLAVDSAIAFLTIQKKLLGERFEFDELLGNFRRLSQVREPSTEEESLFDKGIKVLEKINSSLPPVYLRDVNIDDIAEELKVLESAMRLGESREEDEDKKEEKNKRKETGWLWTMLKAMDLFSGGLPYALREMERDLETFDGFIAELRSIDSVYLNQAANYLTNQIDFYRAILKGEEVKTSEELPDVLPDKKKLSRFNHLTTYGSSYSVIEEMRDKKDTPFKKTLKQLDALFLFSQLIAKEGLIPVEFNETGEVRLTDSFSIFKPKKEQVKNDVHLSSEDRRVSLLTGPNGSGKTFYEKGTLAAVLMALSTGFTPAQRATMPIFDSVVYLDRVVEKQDKKLSAFSQEIEYWKELLSLVRKKRSVFAVADEAFSSTSPTYQAAFTYAIIAEFLQSNHFLMLSTHNHEVVDQLEEQQTESVKPLHFKFSVKDGEIKYNYVVQEGHEQSHASEVAKMMGLPEDIVYAAS